MKSARITQATAVSHESALSPSVSPAVSPASANAAERFLGLLSDFLCLIKPRISFFVVLAAFTGGLLGAGPSAALPEVLLAALAIGAVAAASCVFNQVIERDVDRLMRRTADRPLVTGRLSVRDAVVFGAALAAFGTSALAVWFHSLAALLALATLVAYVLVYTPLKRYSSFNTLVGAIPGAMPPLLGHVALAGEPGHWGWFLFGVIFIWQFPHFLAIAWMYREDYRRAGMKMLPALDAADGLAGRQAFLYGLVLVPVSLLPVVRGEAGLLFAVVAFLLGLVYVGAAALFALRETHARARATLFASLVYLPLLFSAALLDPVVSQVLIARMS